MQLHARQERDPGNSIPHVDTDRRHVQSVASPKSQALRRPPFPVWRCSPSRGDYARGFTCGSERPCAHKRRAVGLGFTLDKLSKDWPAGQA